MKEIVGKIPKVTPDLTNTQCWKTVLYSNTSHVQNAYSSLHSALYSSVNISEDISVRY